MSGCLFTVVAPSGAGKSSLVAGLLERDTGIELSVSYTTRSPRAGEVDGREYHFVTREKFKALIDADEFLEHAEVYGNLYGTSRRWIESRRTQGSHVLLEIDWQGARSVKKIFPDMVYIYILPPSIDELRRRLIKRGKDSAAIIERRLSEAREDLKHVHKADYVIINEDFGVALDDLSAVTRACQLTASRQIALNAKLLK
ncbi:guanylate kinase [Betaproteobacteria bacterium UKL13-2]|jgi:guanylate kinase|nr:guanylate kinase [Betaproteobacteria bacterium UKL13-2]HCG53898.1 guanylate kinase [Betaproteobacteria bacterium]